LDTVGMKRTNTIAVVFATIHCDRLRWAIDLKLSYID
jgi:hypothetical protein